MAKVNIDLNNFSNEPQYFPETNLLLTVKSFNLQEIRERYLESRKRSKSGSIKRREPAEGGLVFVKIKNGQIEKQKVLARYKEARGIDYKKNYLAISSEDKIYIINTTNGEIETIQNLWFSYIHTVKFNQDLSKLLVASSGVDTILEIDLDTKSQVWEWNAWEEGINEGKNPETGEKHILTRNPDEAEKLEKNGKKVLLIQDPKEDKLPTALRAAFINSAEYCKDGDILVTFFHDGFVQKMNKSTKELKPIITDLNKPHGGIEYNNFYMATDTAGGKVVIKEGKTFTNFDFSELPGKDPRLGDLEWLQTSHMVDENIITVDSNRTSLVYFNPEENKKMKVPYNSNWAVQDFVKIDSQPTNIENYLEDLYE